eukprot:scaffold15863_cov27-Tisochrysis_lutea.AAC.3
MAKRQAAPSGGLPSPLRYCTIAAPATVAIIAFRWYERKVLSCAIRRLQRAILEAVSAELTAGGTRPDQKRRAGWCARMRSGKVAWAPTVDLPLAAVCKDLSAGVPVAGASRQSGHDLCLKAV